MTATDEKLSYSFRHGEDMDPTLVLQAHPAARFVARARISNESGAWGILLTIPAGSEPSGSPVGVVTDDGRVFTASMLTSDHDVADRDATIAAARYWELPPEYIRRLGGIEEETTA